MTLDLSTLSAAELDALIAEAAERRAQMAQDVPHERPEGAVTAKGNPAWYVTPGPGGTLLQICHPGLGWLAFVIPPVERGVLVGLLLQQTLVYLSQAAASRATPADPVAPSSAGLAGSGGGSVH